MSKGLDKKSLSLIELIEITSSSSFLVELFG
jgi:hypothetical protein